MNLINYAMSSFGCDDCTYYDYWVDDSGPHNLCRLTGDQYFPPVDRCIDSKKFKTLEFFSNIDIVTRR